eukprot:1158359-Pelagomonas_calceolata.AAC.2
MLCYNVQEQLAVSRGRAPSPTRASHSPPSKLKARPRSASSISLYGSAVGLDVPLHSWDCTTQQDQCCLSLRGAAASTTSNAVKSSCAGDAASFAANPIQYATTPIQYKSIAALSAANFTPEGLTVFEQKPPPPRMTPDLPCNMQCSPACSTQ